MLIWLEASFNNLKNPLSCHLADADRSKKVNFSASQVCNYLLL
ncbi:hypothetical protein ADINL_0654 [Nitrincola lacisaponensis]|uniref:Uncharacterized protein n=1 Tax=Nitrincola lacisaponensis TaxID=267850 RepID=A0A063Y7D2_9GAMM|nr:hypothetical protein ADINL_0654 [Nitrincola lacisaponensis]